jgi:hypothetical protein
MALKFFRKRSAAEENQGKTVEKAENPLEKSYSLNIKA